MKRFTQDDCEFTLECIPEEIPPEGNLGIDKETDRQILDWICDQLDRGNQWAWCTVVVRCSRPDTPDVVGSGYLGCCSYESEKEFRQPGGYYDDMRQQAFENYIGKLEQLASAICD